MDLAQLKDELRAAKLHPVHVEGSPLEDRLRDFTFIGDLPEYVEAVHALGTSVVLVFTEVLNEHRFHYAPRENSPPPDDAGSVDLCAIKPGLSKFKNKIGETAMFKLSAAMAGGNLSYYINEKWWLDFMKLWEDATDQVELEYATTQARIQSDREAKNRNVLKALADLIHEEEFVTLPTQRAMIAYALDKVPGLTAVDEIALKAEIQTLHAKIKAKGLDRKR